MGVAVMLDLLPAVGKSNDKFVIVTVRLTADLVKQSGVLAFEKPNHRWVYRPVAAGGLVDLAP
jgi:hypothetical protein